MGTRHCALFLIGFLLSPVVYSFAGDGAQVDSFSPQGTVKNVRQVTARFSEQMVPFGEPRLVEPFEVKCPEKGRARWADGRNWVYDFDKDLPAGVICEFTLKPDAKTLSGRQLTGQKTFSFSTGGPAIIQSHPYEGSLVDEDQIFLFTLDAEPQEDSVTANTFCSIEGIKEQVGVRPFSIMKGIKKIIRSVKGKEEQVDVRIIKGEERKKVLRIIRRRRVTEEQKEKPVIALQCRQSFPSNAVVRVIWGQGIKSLSGVTTTEDQILSFKAREPFTANFSCERVNPDAGCVPISPMYLGFSAPVARKVAGKITLKGPDNKVYRPSKGQERDENQEFVQSLSFPAPFPENTTFTLHVPKDIKDDAGRTMVNIDKFPLTIKTDSYPPLAKFSSRFGIIELDGDAVLPVTLRNLEPEVKARMLELAERKGVVEKRQGLFQRLRGQVYKVEFHNDEEVMDWLERVAEAGRRSSILSDVKNSHDLSIPKPGGARAFEVVGIPLNGPGLHIVEIESQILGASLLGEQRPMYVSTAVLVTNLTAHFKWGRESSLVWVTTLNKAQPVEDASVIIRDCHKKIVWEGKTDKDGIAYIGGVLPSHVYCDSGGYPYGDYAEPGNLHGLNYGYFIFAKTSDDITFVHTTWDNGIEPWRYNLPQDTYRESAIAHTVFDRTLLRAGETVSMKHFMRRHTMDGFSLIGATALPKSVVITHQGSDQRYEFPVQWDGNGTAETTWKIPIEAKLGQYRVTLLKKSIGKSQQRTSIGGYERGDEEYYSPESWPSGSFRVEEFRVPLMKGIIQPPKEPLINVRAFVVDLLVSYLSGGGAGNMAVKLRSQAQPKPIILSDFEGFVFANGEVKEGIVRRSFGGEEDEEGGTGPQQGQTPAPQTRELVLDAAGTLRATITGLPKVSVPHDIHTELEFRDPNGEIQTVSNKVPLWPSKVLVGIKPDAWASAKENFKFHVAVVDLSSRPVPDTQVTVGLFQRKFYSHRRRIVGGFYSYEHVTETKPIGRICEGKSNSKGLVICDVKSPVSGNVILQARASDGAGNPSTANRDVWIAGKDEWWFDVSDNDRIDILPEKKRYEPGDAARFQVRMPFREATALVSIEREGVMDRFIQKLSGKNPMVEVAIKNNYAPNIFVSVLCVRGRVGNIQPTALIDLGRPAYKLGIAEVNVGWRAHELKVKIISERDVYKIREKVLVKVKASQADETPPPKGSEVAISVVDEGLLELMPNKSWDLLDAMMGRRGYEVRTSTVQMHVVGKRHYGLKALPHGGGGGRQVTREMFDTLLLWKGRVVLDGNGEASVEVPLNDSLTSFRIAAVVNGGVGLFGTGEKTIRTTQDLMLLSGLPSLVREGDKYKARFTVRNASDKKMKVNIVPVVSDGAAGSRPLEKVKESLDPGEAKEVGWDAQVPIGTESTTWEVGTQEEGGDGKDMLKVKQKVVPAVHVRTFQATIAQLDKSLTMTIERPEEAVVGKGGVNISLRSKLSNGLGGVVYYMKNYPYICMEQKVSRAVALRDKSLWEKVISELPSHMDSDGLIKYFPLCCCGSDSLTAYILSIAHEAGWEIPFHLRTEMANGLKGFIEGRVIRWSSLPTADVSIRKMAALEALSRYGEAEVRLLDSITIEPNLWPTSAVIDWINVLLRVGGVPEKDKKFREVEQVLKTRLNFQGTTMGFSTEGMDNLWWLMVSTDVNAVRGVLTFLKLDDWKEDMPRIVRGAIGRQHRGAWTTTVANAWGVLAMEKFSDKFESIRVEGLTSALVEDGVKEVDWGENPDGGSMMFGWPKEQKDLRVSHKGKGKPWVTVQSLAAIPLKEGFSSGYKIVKSIAPVEQRHKGKWSRGDVIRVKLEMESQADMTWVVVSDPVPAGSTILGGGLGRDSQILTKGEEHKGWVWPAFEERSTDAFRAYYEFVPKGRWTVEYTLRLNTEGVFRLPETRVEALYSPEMLGEIPNARFEIGAK